VPEGTEARGFVLYVGVDELKAAAAGTDLGAIVEALKALTQQLVPNAETHAAVALAPKGVGGRDVDYVMFGPLGGAPDAQAAELAQWWAETFEVPAVHSNPAAEPGAEDATGAEFLALSDCVWIRTDPASALKSFTTAAKGKA